MQDVLEQWIKDRNEFLKGFTLTDYASTHNLVYKREYTVKEVSRRADFIILKGGKQLVNVELKVVASKLLIDQLDSHAEYCDYCFACLPDFCLTPEWFKNMLCRKGYGLIVYNEKHKIITEVFEAHHQRPKNKQLRRSVINDLKTVNLSLFNDNNF